MSKLDDGFGHGAGPNPGPQSDFTRRPNVAGAPGMPTWGNNALNPRPGGANPMAPGVGQPGRPAGGPPPMFGGGSPVFAPMPSYTPVTRGPDPRQQIPQPAQPAYDPYASVPPQPNPPMPQQPVQETAPGYGHPQPQSPSNYATPEMMPGYQNVPQGTPDYQTQQYPSAPGQVAAPNYQTPEPGNQAYQQPHPLAFPGDFGSQPYQGDQAYEDQGVADASFSETSGGDASFPDASFDQNFADPNFADQDFSAAGFAERPEADASFPEQGFAGDASFDQQDGQPEQGFEQFAEEDAAQDYGGHAAQGEPGRQLQPFDAGYDQPPQIPLGSPQPAHGQSQDFYEGERLDADFLDETQIVAAQGDAAKDGSTLRSRSAVMVGAALLGAIALGGALAFAYKQSGGGLGSEPPPLVQADSSPVKAVPDQPGGKEFPHKNKLIYDRLQNADEPQSERLVPRQEDVAVPALPGASPAEPAAVATTDAAPPTTQAVPGAVPVAAVSDPSAPDGGPRKVRTMVVRPDGSVEAAAAPPAAAAAAPQAAAANPQAAPPAPAPAPANAAPQQTASVPAPEAKPEPPAQQTAAAAPEPKPAAPAKPKEYLVQVASKKDQTDALASFADMQQKYPTLLADYRPIVQRANLGAKGTWYRLRIGPVADKTAASKLCSQLKSQGLPDCLVIAQ